MLNQVRKFTVFVFVVCMISVAYISIADYFEQNLVKELVYSAAPKSIEPQSQPSQIQKDIILESQAEIEIFGLIKLKISENNSWSTIAKILVTILTTWLGLKAINFGFKKLESKLAKN